MAGPGGGGADAKQKVSLALCQLTVGEDKNANWDTMRAAVKEAAGHGAKLVVLPEMWNCPYSNDSFPVYAEDIDGGASESAQLLSQAAREHSVTLVGGSIPETSDDKLYNTCCVYGPDGSLLGKHQKVHLFDIDIPGKMTFKESETLTPGRLGTVVDTPHGTIAIGICYDLRFPELAQMYAKKGANIIIYPGAFNTTTGPLHWELLLRARATDNQLFVAACSPARNEDASYQAWGHSTVVSPNGEVLATTAHEAGIVYAELDLAEVAERRRNMPLTQQKRHDLYELVDKTA
jgi:omega-amidase